MHPLRNLKKPGVKRHIVSRVSTLVPAKKGEYGRVQAWGFRVLAVKYNGRTQCPVGWEGIRFVLSSDARKAIKFIEEVGGSYKQWREQTVSKNRKRILI